MTDSLGKALIAEDNPALSAVIEFTVKRAGFQVTTAPNGADALDKALSETFDVVISDHQMPKMQGTEMLARLREHEQYAETPMVLLTAKKLEIDFEQLRREIGIARILPKPFSPHELAALLNELVAAGVG